jgi:hypothetical protein
MAEPTIPHGTLSPFGLQRLGEVLRGRYQLLATLPAGVHDLVMKLDQNDGRMKQPKQPDERWRVTASREIDYRRQAVETMRLAQQASSSSVKTRLVNLAEAWIELAEKTRKAGQLFRS